MNCPACDSNECFLPVIHHAEKLADSSKFTRWAEHYKQINVEKCFWCNEFTITGRLGLHFQGIECTKKPNNLSVKEILQILI